MAEPLLSLRGVDLALPDLARRPFLGRTPLKAILQGVDLDVAAGESVGLVGESGSGKSTLARTALRLHEPQAGRILFAGKDITHADEVEVKPLRERMQMIFQDPMSSLNPRRRIGEIVAQPLRVAGREAGVATVARLLAQVQLPADFARRYPHELSGGQRQRVGIARAIALAPALIVADEIVSGLDVSTQAHILILLRELKRDLGLALLFVSHDLSVVRVLCDRIVVLRDGRVVETAPVAELFARPTSGYSRALLDAIPLPDVDPHWLDLAAGEEETAMKIQGCTALVTGANRGLGRAIEPAAERGRGVLDDLLEVVENDQATAPCRDRVAQLHHGVVFAERDFERRGDGEEDAVEAARFRELAEVDPARPVAHSQTRP